MDIKTQNLLRTLDTDKNGLTIKELKVLDSNKDGKLDNNDTGLKNTNHKDLNELNSKMSMGKAFTNFSILPMDNLIAYKSSELNSRIFPGGVKEISPSDIDQNGIGDCYYLSSLASLAQQRPQDIVNMIKDNGNGTCTVTFPQKNLGIKTPVKVTVSIPTDDEISKYEGAGKGSNGSVWGVIMEKAYIEGHLFGKTEVESSGFMIGKGISDITGNSTDVDYLGMTRDKTTRNKIEQKIKDNKIIVASTFGDGDKSKNISPSHVYSILAYDRATDMVTVRNPWGTSGEPKDIQNNDGVKDGVFKLSLKEFNDLFSLICYED